MTVSLVSNLASQYAQSAIKARSDAVNTDTLQLSSGQRVFSAVQDAAALAVGAGLKIDNAGLASAKINAGAATSMLQIADGALGTVSDILVRMQTLAVQSSSGQNSDADRQPVDLEFQALLTELNRIAGATNFNGVNLLNGQPGYTQTNASNVAADGITNISYNKNSTLGSSPTLRYTYDAATEKMTLTRTDAGVASSQTLDLTAIMDNVAGTGNNLSNGQSISLNFNQIGVTLTLGPVFNRGADILPTAVAAPGAGGVMGTAAAFAPATSSLDGAGVQGLLDIGTALPAVYNSATGLMTLPVVTTAGTVTLGPVAGVSYAVNGGAVGASGAASADLTAVGASTVTTVDVYVDTTGGPQKVGTVSITGDITGTGAGSGTLDISAGQGLESGALQTANANTLLTYKIGTGIVNGQDLLQVSLPPVNADSLGLTGVGVGTQFGANAAIDALKAAVQMVSNARAVVGAQQSRLSQVSTNINVFSENNETARSALVDVDVPGTISDLVDNQAVLQAGIAMLAQSNKIPQMLLNLLQN
jgi:flagellin